MQTRQMGPVRQKRNQASSARPAGSGLRLLDLPSDRGRCFASFRPDDPTDLRSGYGAAGRGTVLTKPFLPNNIRGRFDGWS